MSKSQKTGKMPAKVGKKAKIASVPEKTVEKQPEIEILPNVNRKSKLEAELDIRYENLKNFVSKLESSRIPVSDYEKILSMAFDCRNSARKLEKIESPVIIA